jgi:hypothetical protein
MRLEEEDAIGAYRRWWQTNPKQKRAGSVRSFGAPIATKVILDVLETMDNASMV